MVQVFKIALWITAGAVLLALANVLAKANATRLSKRIEDELAEILMKKQWA